MICEDKSFVNNKTNERKKKKELQKNQTQKSVH